VQHDTQRVITHQEPLALTSGCTTPDSWAAILTPSSSSLCLLEQGGCYNPREVPSSNEDWVFLSLDEISLSSTTIESICPEGESIQSLPSAIPSALFICPLCPPTSNRFRTAKDLQSHQSSPVHAPRIFHYSKKLSIGNGQGPESLQQEAFLHSVDWQCISRAGLVASGCFERLKDVGLREICLVT
jgi:hypothetical protein